MKSITHIASAFALAPAAYALSSRLGLDPFWTTAGFLLGPKAPDWLEIARKLLSYKEPQGDFFARVPGEQRSMSYPSTVAYIAALMLWRLRVRGLLDTEGKPVSGTSVQENGKTHAHSERPCPECGSHTLIKYNGCEKCTTCGYVGSCG